MSAAFYQNDINSFKSQNQEEILGIIVHNDEYDSGAKQKDAWIAQIDILKRALSKIDRGSILFEYTLPRVFILNNQTHNPQVICNQRASWMIRICQLLAESLTCFQ